MPQHFALNLGDGNTGLTDLRAQILNSIEAVVSTASTGFTELSGGQYTWTGSIPSTGRYVRFYSNAAPTTYFFTLAVVPDAEVPASTDPETINAYLYTRDSNGSIVADTTVFYQLVGLDDGGDSFDDDVQEVISDDEGLAEIEMVVGGHYRYWIGSGRFKTAHITADTADPYGTSSGGSFTSIGEVVDAKGPDISVGKVEFTHYGTSGYKEFKSSILKEVADIELDINYVKAMTTTLFTLLGDDTKWWKITLPDNSTYVFPGFLSKIGQETPVQNRVKNSVSITVTGVVTFTAG